MYRRFLSGLLAAVVLATLFTGCDSFLQKSPQGELTSENFFRNAEDAQRALNATYDYAQARSFDFFPPYPMIFGSIASDNATKGGESGVDQISVQRVDQFNPRPTDPYVASTWNTLYTGIYRANLVIENVPDIESMDADEREQMVGEAKFLRAYFHFYALKMYGLGDDRANDGPGIPLITEPLPASEADVPRTPEADVWTQIETDLREAATAMDPTAPDLGRATQGAAKALRVKAHIFQEEWGEAQPLAQDIISSGRYSLDPDYSRIFDQR
ncbi:MAG TPA: RagB/SusD family nutrient uptake outer membrane protein, partial [Salinibacter sp.]|nr:RagB/SusD family nutrient uptake outer membrane protein [Salinibacter sp.]